MQRIHRHGLAAVSGMILASAFVPLLTAPHLHLLSTPTAHEPGEVGETPPTRPLSGLDISHYQGEIDWKKLKQQSETDFVWLKATQGQRYVDPTLRRNALAATATGMPFGIYHFYEPTLDAKRQAKHFLQQYRSVASSLRPVLDVEIAHDVDKKELVAGIRIWLATVEAATGCQPLLYSNKSFWMQYLAADFSAHPLWLAQYRQEPPEGDWLIWQRTQNGRVPGIAGYVDMNTAHPELTDISRLTCEGRPA